MSAKFQASYTYAQWNGFKGSVEDYIQKQYEAYVSILDRNLIKPMTKQEWLEGQK